MGGRWKKQLAYSREPESWGFLSEAPPFTSPPEQSFLGQPCQFALQPIIESLRGQISSFEALIRGPKGESPQDYFASIPPDKLHETDLSSKAWAWAWALALAKNINIGSHKISINLLPMSLVKVPNAVDILLEQIDRNGLVPEQVIVEVTEDEVISSFDAFSSAIQQLRSAGIGVAIAACEVSARQNQNRPQHRNGYPCTWAQAGDCSGHRKMLCGTGDQCRCGRGRNGGRVVLVRSSRH